MKQIRLYSITAVAALSLSLFVGCTSKKYVRQQTAPLMDHVNQLDTLTAKNTNDIKDVDARTQKGIAAVNQSTEQAMAQAQKAQTDANQVGNRLDQTSGRIESIASTVANLDDYQPAYKSAVHFAFDRYNLTPEAKQTLDDLAARLQQNKHAIVQVEGFTDAIGGDTYNYELSKRRADSVVSYLESKSIPPHRIFLIGLGKNQFVADNHTRAGRKQNRRVELTLMTNVLGRQQNPQANPATQTQQQ